jgi:hypothetical protein
VLNKATGIQILAGVFNEAVGIVASDIHHSDRIATVFAGLPAANNDAVYSFHFLTFFPDYWVRALQS